jgi:multidrug efflux pump subunit AcrA (membrane-fusion protein)
MTAIFMSMHFTGVKGVGPCRLDRLTNVLWVGRPAKCQPNTTGTVFKLVQSGKQVVQVQVEFGQSSAISVEIRSGLAPGDRVILNEIAQFRQYDWITLK